MPSILEHRRSAKHFYVFFSRARSHGTASRFIVAWESLADDSQENQIKNPRKKNPPRRRRLSISVNRFYRTVGRRLPSSLVFFIFLTVVGRWLLFESATPL